MRRWTLMVGMAVIVSLLGLRPGRAAEKEDKKEEGKRVVAVFRWAEAITETPGDELFLFGGAKPYSLKDLVARLDKAARDDKVKAVVFLSDGGSAGSAQLEELRQAIRHVRDAKKEVYVYADTLTTREYVLLSGASRISMVPTADLWLTGLYGESPYLRGLLNKLGVKPDFIARGDYKSAGEIFMREGPSPAAEKMQNWLLDSVYETYVKLIADGRGVEADKVRDWIDKGPYTAERAKEAGLIDAVEHRQDFEKMLKDKFGRDVVFDKRYGQKKNPDVDFSSPFAMFKIWADLLGETQKKKPTKDAVGIVYVEGPIVLGGSQASVFSDQVASAPKLRKALDEAARDKTIKAVVLRINSPGGSAVASEIILDATKRVRAKKPFIVSMGDVAGSGGYYVACGSDTIYADGATITGSIGVIGGKFATNDMWKKVGITFKSYKRGANAGILSSDSVWTAEERKHMEEWMDEIYKVFKDHVVAARGKRLQKPIDDIAGGRVYTGKQALELGLVDKLGTLEDAVHHVAAAAKLKDYDVRVVPRPKNFLEELIEEASGEAKDEGKGLDTAVCRAGGERRPSLADLAMPYLRDLDPQRVRTIKTALERLQLMQQEGAILMMPEMTLGR